MGRWSQARKRGTASDASSASVPAAPGDADWLWDDSDFPSGEALFIGVPPAGVIGWQLWAHNGILAYAYADQDPAGFNLLVFTGPAVTLVPCYGKVRYIVSGAGVGDPDTIYSDFSNEKVFTD